MKGGNIYQLVQATEPLPMKPSSSELAVANSPEGSSGLFGDLGGTGGGTLVFDPGGLSHNTAGRFNVSGAASSVAEAVPPIALFSGDVVSGDEVPENDVTGGAAASGVRTVVCPTVVKATVVPLTALGELDFVDRWRWLTSG